VPRRDEDLLAQMAANPLQLYRKNAIDKTLKVATILEDQFKGQVPVQRLLAELDVNWGYKDKALDYLRTLNISGRIVWDKEKDTISVVKVTHPHTPM